ncbi:NirA-like nitrate assimilation regulatory protein [Fusarium napiforme]|uniref:NirA-like nitrate assimilation regulatory protein n=1 Tax=Fusarium napiforme TaxID=42672 RepID=A0A8H5JEK3_9HYPO|nr:NirA-like nitrate assimilation regulatory protein [Fusarium napiforme]
MPSMQAAQACVACQQKDSRCTYPPLKRYRRAPEGHLLEESTLEEETPQQNEDSSMERERGLQAVSQFSSSPPATEPAEHQQQNEPEQQQELYNDHQDDLVIDGGMNVNTSISSYRNAVRNHSEDENENRNRNRSIDGNGLTSARTSNRMRTINDRSINNIRGKE